MARLDEAENIDLGERAKELAHEAERLRQEGDSNQVREADKKLSESIESLRRIARQK